MDAIRAKSLRLTAAHDRAGRTSTAGRVGSPREEARRGGTVCLDVPDAERVCQALLASDVLLDYRPGVGLRLAPHFYTREDEVDAVVRRIRDELGRGSELARRRSDAFGHTFRTVSSLLPRNVQRRRASARQNHHRKQPQTSGPVAGC